VKKEGEDDRGTFAKFKDRFAKSVNPNSSVEENAG
jgi:hypothetical protein